MIERLDVPVAGGTLAVFRLGQAPAERPPVVAVHGITANSRAWLAVARALEGRVALLAVDLRGRAASAALPGPYGIAAYARDLLAVLDHFGLERAVLAGHSLGAFAVARLAAEHPERVHALVLADGGVSGPLPPGIDPQDVVKAALGPALARLEMTFPSRPEYHAWWRAHPSFAGPAVTDEDLAAYADHDLTGSEPELRSGVVADAIRADAGELLEMGEPAQRLTVPVELLRAPRGLLNDANVMIPPDVARAWADAAPASRRVLEVADVNHYTLVMGTPGADAVAQAIVRALQSQGPDASVRSAR